MGCNALNCVIAKVDSAKIVCDDDGEEILVSFDNFDFDDDEKIQPENEEIPFTKR